MKTDIIDQLVANDFFEDGKKEGEFNKAKGDHYVNVTLEDGDPVVRVRRYSFTDTQIGDTESFRLPHQANQLLARIAR